MQRQRVCPKEGLAHGQLHCCSGTRTAWSLTGGSETSSWAGGQPGLEELHPAARHPMGIWPGHSSTELGLGDEPSTASPSPGGTTCSWGSHTPEPSLSYCSHLVLLTAAENEALEKQQGGCPSATPTQGPGWHLQPPSPSSNTRSVRERDNAQHQRTE